MISWLLKSRSSAISALQFKKPVLVYIPCYNCERSVVEVLSNMPPGLKDKAECLIVDNQSQDRTVDLALGEVQKGIRTLKISIIRPKKNLGYAGSQKLAYSLVLNSPEVKHVIMMHGDGQYPSSLLAKFVSETDKGYALVNAYRDRNTYGKKEETPPLTYFIIKTLSGIENLLTGFKYKEWQNGYVMYGREFLRKIPLELLSDDLQIDGEFLICAGILKEKIFSLPIYKKYKLFEAFSGMPRLKYITNIMYTMARFKKGYYHRMLEKPRSNEISFDFDILT